MCLRTQAEKQRVSLEKEWQEKAESAEKEVSINALQVKSEKPFQICKSAAICNSLLRSGKDRDVIQALVYV